MGFTDENMTGQTDGVSGAEGERQDMESAKPLERFCARCGAKNAADARFCNSCGASMEDTQSLMEDAQNTAKRPKKSGQGLLIAMIAGIAAVVIAAAALAFLNSGVKYDADLVGTGELVTDTDGLTALKPSKQKAVIKAVNQKYGAAEIRSLTIGAEIDGEVQFAEEQSGLSLALPFNGTGTLLADVPNQLYQADMNAAVTVFGISLEIEGEMYHEDSATYTKFSVLGSGGEWEKSENNGGEDSGELLEVLELELDADDVRAVYRDEESGCYVVELAPDEDADDSDAVFWDKVSCYVTYDEGIGLIGVCLKAAEGAYSEDGVTLNALTAKLKLDAVNDEMHIAIPEEAKTAETKDALSELEEIWAGAEA